MKYLIPILLLLASPAQGYDFKPLTRDEPVVRMVLQEAVDEPFEGMVAVAGTALDRVADRRWPNTERRVIYQPKQYSGMAYTLQTYSKTQIEGARAAVEVARKGLRPCGLSLWYHADYIKAPSWTRRMKLTCVIGHHLFYGDE